MQADVKEWMSGDPVAIDADASALEALELMTKHAIRHLPVLDAERRVVGVLSVDDLRAAFPVGFDPRTTPSPPDREVAREWPVAEVMTHGPETVRAESSLADAAERMAERRIGCLLVVDEAGRLAGVLSETDVLYALATSLRLDEARERRRAERELDQLVSALREERRRIASRLEALHTAERRLTSDAHDVPGDLADRGAEQTELALTAQLDEQAARRLDAIDRALDRASQGSLGICDRCGGTIPLPRLRALPGTTACVDCARREV